MILKLFRKPAGFAVLSGALVLMLSLLSPPPALAKYDIKQMTPEVEQAIAGRQARYASLQARKAAGAIGENNSGYVEALSPDAGSLADAENKDRKTIYRTMVEQNNLGPNGMSVVEGVFAEVQRENARPGDPIQKPSGEWTKK